MEEEFQGKKIIENFFSPENNKILASLGSLTKK